jgi:hypothetical protein
MWRNSVKSLSHLVEIPHLRSAVPANSDCALRARVGGTNATAKAAGLKTGATQANPNPSALGGRSHG